MKPAIFCKYDELVEISAMKTNPRNPNRHPKRQIELLSKILTQGWRHPIIVSNGSGLIVVGHGRLEAAKLAEMEFVPVEYQDFNSNEEEYAFMLADNRIPELSERDIGALKDLMIEIDTGAIDLEMTGYDFREAEKLFASLGSPSTEKSEKKCPSCGAKI